MRFPWGALAPALLLAAALPAVAAEPELRGAWRAEAYTLKDGTRHPVDGLILFTRSDWLVVFLVLDEQGSARRGSGEGGTYSLSGDTLGLRHRYNVSGGEAMSGLPESPLRLVARDGARAEDEACRAELRGDALTLHFPSGNSMRFRRSSAP